ncbi:hypothetical protein QYF36_010788 [Acer negundo]|nr:hypothetical protein QYF36_010788 [Acer negundo]
MKGDGSSRHGWKRTTTTTCGNRSGEKHELEWREKREMLMKDEMRCDYVRSVDLWRHNIGSPSPPTPMIVDDEDGCGMMMKMMKQWDDDEEGEWKENI